MNGFYDIKWKCSHLTCAFVCHAENGSDTHSVRLRLIHSMLKVTLTLTNTHTQTQTQTLRVNTALVTVLSLNDSCEIILPCSKVQRCRYLTTVVLNKEHDLYECTWWCKTLIVWDTASRIPSRRLYTDVQELRQGYIVRIPLNVSFFKNVLFSFCSS